MSSSWSLANRKAMGPTWQFGDASHPMRGMEDHYLQVQYVNCHPDFKAIPIGGPYGMKICERRKDLPPPPSKYGYNTQDKGKDCKTCTPPKGTNGFYPGTHDMYDATMDIPVQISDPRTYYFRRPPHEQILRRDNYWQTIPDFDGIGLPNHAPKERPYAEMNLAPLKYDITQVVQPYPMWKDSQIMYRGKTQAEMDAVDQQQMAHINYPYNSCPQRAPCDNCPAGNETVY